MNTKPHDNNTQRFSLASNCALVFATGGVSLRGKFIAQGIGTVELVGQGVQIQVSKATPSRLGEFLALFCAKLAARKHDKKNAAAGGSTTSSAAGVPAVKKGKENAVPWLQTAMRSKLYRPPEDIKEISPVSEREKSVCPVLKRSRDTHG